MTVQEALKELENAVRGLQAAGVRVHVANGDANSPGLAVFIENAHYAINGDRATFGEGECPDDVWGRYLDASQELARAA